MMLTLDDIRGYIGGLGIVADSNVYIGKLNSKKDHSIGVYHRQGSGPPVMALGGHDYSSYDVRRISLLVHRGYTHQLHHPPGPGTSGRGDG